MMAKIQRMGSECTMLPEIEFTDDILAEILLRLPAESLVEGKLVCKRWTGLITSSYFIRKHLEYWKSRPTILPGYIFTNDPDYYHSAWEEDPLMNSGIELEQRLRDALLMPHLRKYPHMKTTRKVLGSCDGLLLVRVSSTRPQARCYVHGLVVCNPITTSHRVLPPFGSFRLLDFQWTIAFDSSAQRHKIVGIEWKPASIGHRQRYCMARWLIHDLHRGKAKHLSSWKVLNLREPLNSISEMFSKVAFADEVHCLTQIEDNNEVKTIMQSLDLSTESFRPIKIVRDTPKAHLNLNYEWFQSDKAFCYWSMSFCRKINIELWIINDFDNPVWCKHMVRSRHPYFYLVPGIFLADEGKLIAKLGWKLFSYNLRSGERTPILLSGWPYVWENWYGDWYKYIGPYVRQHVSSLVGLD